MKKLAVIGKDVSRSVSPEIHTFIANKTGRALEYSKISIPEEQFESKIEDILGSYDGLNVTIPYKISIIPYLKTLNGDAKIFGAVNTVNCKSRSGDNTDGMGFSMMLQNNGVDVCNKKVLLLGAGGAGRSVAKKLLDGCAKLCVYDINSANVLSLCNKFEGITPLKKAEADNYYLIVNATGIGMHKTEGASPVGSEIISNCEVACDLIYVPEKSRFLTIAAECGKKIINGAGMLFYQAYFAQCIFFGEQPSAEQAKQLFTEYCKEK